MGIEKEIKKELSKLKNIEKQLLKTLQNAPEEKLRCAINNGYYQYYIGKEYQGTDKKELVKKIAQKEYCSQLGKKLCKCQKDLEKLNKLYEIKELENIYKNLHPGRKQLVEPLIKPVEDIIKEFERIEYETKGFDEEDKTEYYSIKGERVRSKSEKIIADELYRYNIPYKYEMPIQLKSRNKIVTVYPDFTVINKRTGKRYIMEHLGMMDKASYYENAMFKLDTYEKNNILIGINLILLHESSSSPINTNVVRKYIENYLC